MAQNSYDLIVVGGGPGGYVAAIRASQLGLKTALIEREHLGGICLNWGCIPTKALLRTADVYETFQHAGQFGLKAENIGYDTQKIVKTSRDAASQLNKGVQHLMKKNKITVVDGHAKLDGPGKLKVTDGNGKDAGTYTASNIVLATGARPRALPGLEPDGKLVWSYKEAMVPDEMPKKLLVVGSGAIGIEFASFYRRMGVEVTVAEAVDRVVPAEDPEISDLAAKAFKKQGMELLTNAKVTKLDKGKDQVTAHIEVGGKTHERTIDRVIMAVGVVGNVEDLNLDSTKAKHEKGQVKVDKWNQTDQAGLYAIGDCAGGPWLAHKASHEGVICVEKIAGVKDVHPMDHGAIPACTYCAPQIASVGLSEPKAKEQGYNVKVGRFPLQANGKAIAMGDTTGLAKTVFNADTGELLGAHMLGAEVTEMIQGYGIARTLETTEQELMETIFPHPTISETMHEAVLDAYGRALHV